MNNSELEKLSEAQYLDSHTHYNLTLMLKRFGIKYFTATEIINTVDNSYIPTLYRRNMIVPLLIWDMCREDVGIQIRLTSTYRDTKQNNKAKGVKFSLHLLNAAIDAQPVNSEYMNRITEWFKTANIQIVMKIDDKITRVTRKDLGIGYYKTFIHCDARRLFNRYAPVTWYEK